MKKLLFSFLFFVTITTVYSQKIYFVYIQSESEQPFFVKLNSKIYSSSGSGYLILSKLIDSSYNFSVGFPQNKWPEQNFTVSINKKDHGFLLKQFGEKGWGLYNLQTSAVLMGSGAGTKVNTTGTNNKEVSAFTEVLSKAADDPSIKEKAVKKKVVEKKAEPVVVNENNRKEEVVVIKEKTEPAPENPAVVVEKIIVEEKKPQSQKPEPVVKPEVDKTNAVEEVKKNVAVEENNPKPKEELVPKTATENIMVQDVSYVPSQVRRWSESSTTQGFGLVFIDDYDNGMRDTIRLLIPNPKQIEIPVSTDKEVKEEKRFIDMGSNTAVKNEDVSMQDVKPVMEQSITLKPVYSNNCTSIASEADFLKLRRQMAAKESDDEMINEARSYFKEKCFTSEQLKNLSSLFLNDEYKYRFFDQSYKYVSDADNFKALQSELKDEYYINRFLAMLRN